MYRLTVNVQPTPGQGVIFRKLLSFSVRIQTVADVFWSKVYFPGRHPMIEEFFLSRIFLERSPPPPFLCLRLFGNGFFPRSIPCRSGYKAKGVPPRITGRHFLPRSMFSIENQAVRILQQFISWFSGTHAITTYLTVMALFDPFGTGSGRKIIPDNGGTRHLPR